MIFIWVKIYGKLRIFKTCSSPSEFTTLMHGIRKTFSAKSFAVTKENELPTQDAVLVPCPVNSCANCPKAIKSSCPQYKGYKYLTQVLNTSTDKYNIVDNIISL